MTKELLAVLASILAVAAPAAAQFEGPGAGSVNTVAEAKQKPDDTSIVLRGSVVKQVAPGQYVFRDDTGDIEVEIDDDLWKGRKVTPDMVVQIAGDVEQDLTETTIDVEALRILETRAGPAPTP